MENAFTGIERLVEGMSARRAVAMARSCCLATSSELWMDVETFEQWHDDLSDGLNDPVSALDVVLLKDVVERHVGPARAVLFLQWRCRERPTAEESATEWARQRHIDQGLTGICPWAHVDGCRDRRIGPEDLARLEGLRIACPQCRREMGELTWFDFTSPQWTREHECGIAGRMAVCDACRLQVTLLPSMVS